MKQIPLTRGLFALVDDADFDFLAQFNWYAQMGYDGSFYAARRLSVKEDSKRRIAFMHRFIMNCLKDKHVDHRDHNQLNNQRGNLRLCSNAENGRNQLKSKKRGTSKYKGVCLIIRRSQSKKIGIAKECSRKWKAQITYNYKNIIIGNFDNEQDAAIAYNEKAKEIFGEFALLNEI